MVFNYLLFRNLKKDLQTKYNQKVQQLYISNQDSKRYNSDMIIMERINSLNIESRDELLKIIDRKLKVKFQALQAQQNNLQRMKNKLKINYLEIASPRVSKTLSYNSANYHTFRRYHELKESRLKKRHSEIKGQFVETYDISNLENKRKYENLEDNLSLDLIAMKEQHRMQRKRFREQKFIQMK
jgi:hypothetical protein